MPAASPSLIDAAARYVGILAWQYADQPNARAQVQLYAAQALMFGLGFALQDAFTLGTAAGQQLDWIGEYIGLSRDINTGSVTFFGFWNSTWSLTVPPTPVPPGLRDSTSLGAGGTNANSIFMDASQPLGPTTNLADAQYLAALELQIIENANDGGMASIQTFIAQYFPGMIAVVDNVAGGGGRGSGITYNVSHTIPIPAAVLQNRVLNLSGVLHWMLPKPMGCPITVNIV